MLFPISKPQIPTDTSDGYPYTFDGMNGAREFKEVSGEKSLLRENMRM